MGAYTITFSAATTLTILGTQHQLGTPDLVFQFWDASMPRNAIGPSTLTVDETTFDIVATFGVPQDGALTLLSGIDTATPPPIPGPGPLPPTLAGMHPTLQAMLVQMVSHQPYIGQNSYGQPVYGPAVTRPARLQYEVATLTNPPGQERISTTRVFFNGDFAPLTVRDKLVLGDGMSPAIQQVYSAMKAFSNELDHYEVLL